MDWLRKLKLAPHLQHICSRVYVQKKFSYLEFSRKSNPEKVHKRKILTKFCQKTQLIRNRLIGNSALEAVPCWKLFFRALSNPEVKQPRPEYYYEGGPLGNSWFWWLVIQSWCCLVTSGQCEHVPLSLMAEVLRYRVSKEYNKHQWRPKSGFELCVWAQTNWWPIIEFFLIPS